MVENIYKGNHWELYHYDRGNLELLKIGSAYILTYIF